MLFIGERYRHKLQSGLDRLGHSAFWLPDNPSLDPRLAGHADLSIFMPEGRTIIAAGEVYRQIAEHFIPMGFRVERADGLGPRYPQDAGLCVFSTGCYTLYNPKTIHPKAISYLRGIRIAVRQGYTNCSVCAADQKSIITADPRIAALAGGAGMYVLRIAQGHIELEGFDYGFIGGAAFLLDASHMAFTGTLDQHPDRRRILDFIESRGISPVFLTGEPLFDIGCRVFI